MSRSLMLFATLAMMTPALMISGKTAGRIG